MARNSPGRIKVEARGIPGRGVWAKTLSTKWHSIDKQLSLYFVGNEEPLTDFRQGWQYGQIDILQRQSGSKEGGE